MAHPPGWCKGRVPPPPLLGWKIVPVRGEILFFATLCGGRDDYILKYIEDSNNGNLMQLLSMELINQLDKNIQNDLIKSLKYI